MEAVVERERIDSIDGLYALIDRLKAGTVSIEELRAAYEVAYENREAISASVAKRYKVADLKARSYGLHRGNKPELVAAYVEQLLNLLGGWSIGKDLTITYSFMSKRVDIDAKMHQKRLDNLAAATQADLDAYAEMEAEKAAQRERAAADPQTLGEFGVFIKANGMDALTPALWERMDRLCFERDQEKIAQARHFDNYVSQVHLPDDTRLAITGPFTHTKKGFDYWLVKIDGDRLPKEQFNDLRAKARRHDGWYTRSWNGNPEATGGFSFKTEEAAERFADLQNQGADISDLEAAREEAKRERAADRLGQYAERHMDAAHASLTAERLVNTVRRANMAHSAEMEARTEEAQAAMILSVANAMEAGTLDALAGLRHASQILELYWRIMAARSEAVRKEKGHYVPPSEMRAPTYDDIQFAEYPYPYFHGSLLRSLHQAAKGRRGTAWNIKALEKAIKIVDESGDSGKQFNRETTDAILELAALPAAAGEVRREVYDRAISYRRLQAIGITSPALLRHALRELFPHFENPGKPDPVIMAERALIGNNIPGFFWTPADVADEMAAILDLNDGDIILDPSAGKGDLLEAAERALPDFHGATVQAIEINGRLAELLGMKGISVVGHDFMDYEPAEEDRPTVIIANPPFEDGQDRAHVKRMYGILQDGGRMVAIISGSPKNSERGGDPERYFGDWLDEVGGYVVRDLPQGTFAAAGTQVGAQIIYIEK